MGFSYGNSSRIILQDFCLTVTGNEKVGIVGESGIGKSTVLRLLLRFWNAKGGQLRINGIPIEQIPLTELRRRIAVLEQDTFLFNGSIAENIALGRPDAAREEIEEAARRAGLSEFIRTLPDGYETQMGQMGARLSGGERQRVGIARVMLMNPDVIVMDEPHQQPGRLARKRTAANAPRGMRGQNAPYRFPQAFDAYRLQPDHTAGKWPAFETEGSTGGEM